MKRVPSLVLPALLLAAAGCSLFRGGGPDPAASTLTALGDPAPGFTVPLLDGGAFALDEQRGKVVLVNWWATWCPPCVEEMPHLQERVWERFHGEDFTMVAVSREETSDVVGPWIAEQGYTFPVGLDTERKGYARYAEAYIPRSYVIGRDGTILFQSNGFEEDEFAAMIETIAAALAEGP